MARRTLAGRALAADAASARCSLRALRSLAALLAHAGPPKGQGRGRLAVAAGELGLVGDAAMLDAIREAGIGRVAAEVEIGLTRMAHRPFADLLVEIEQAGLVGDLRARLGGTRRRGGAGGIGACWSPGPWRTKPPGPIERTSGWAGAGAAGVGRAAAAGACSSSASGSSARSKGGSPSTSRDVVAGKSTFSGCAGAGAGWAVAAGASSAACGSFGFTGEGRDCRPSRWALPITALRDTAPNSSAIWLAVMPRLHISFKRSILSSVQDIPFSREALARGGGSD
jgi:hypothetical protein